MLGGGLEAFRHHVGDLVALYGETYRRDASFIFRSLEEFAARHGHTFADALRSYELFLKDVLEENRLFAASGRYRFSREEEIKDIVGDERFQLHYLYALTLSTPLNRSRYEVFLHYRRVLAAHLTPGGRLLEVGGGNCLDSLSASDYGRVDVYEMNRLSLLWQEVLGLEGKINLKIEYCPFEARGEYDFVSMIELLEHVSDPAAYLHGAHAVLKDEGRAYFTFAVRMPQVDHLYQFDTIEECRALLHDNDFKIVEDYCTINTHRAFAEEERWALAASGNYPVTYTCLVRKQPREEVEWLLEGFNEGVA